MLSTVAQGTDIWISHFVPGNPPLGGQGQGLIRLAPLTSEQWLRRSTGNAITMLESRPTSGTATITEVERFQYGLTATNSVREAYGPEFHMAAVCTRLLLR